MSNRHFVAPLTEEERIIEGVEFIDHASGKRCRVRKRRKIQRLEEWWPGTQRWIYWRHITMEDRQRLGSLLNPPKPPQPPRMIDILRRSGKRSLTPDGVTEGPGAKSAGESQPAAV